MQPLISGVNALLCNRHLPLVLALLASVLMLWALDEGFIMDDYVHRAKFLGWLHEGSESFSHVLNIILEEGLKKHKQ